MDVIAEGECRPVAAFEFRKEPNEEPAVIETDIHPLREASERYARPLFAGAKCCELSHMRLKKGDAATNLALLDQSAEPSEEFR